MTKTVFAAALLIWMGIIFIFSAQPAAQSAATSTGFSRAVLSVLPGYSSETEASREQMALNLDYLARKAAHFSSYAVLGILAFSFFWSLPGFKAARLRSVLISVGFCAVYAGSDEWHQWFVPGRACLFTDVLLDTAGSLVGVLLIFLLRPSVRRRTSP